MPNNINRMVKLQNIFSIRRTALVLFLLTVVISFSPAFDKSAKAVVTPGDLHGYAWSMGIGWIGLNCAEGSATLTDACATSNYKVTVSNTGAMFGFAWSPSVGWIAFQPSWTSSCGTAASLDTTTGVMSGWAKAINAASGLYDGCIKLKSTGSDPAFGITYNPASVATSTFGPGIPFNSGSYAWGDLNLGWIDFSKATFNATSTTVDIKINILDGAGAVDGPVTMTSAGGAANLTWTSTGAAGCSASASSSSGAFASGWSGAKATSSASPFAITVPSNATAATIDYQYMITCSGISDLVIVHVPPPAPAACTISPGMQSLSYSGSTVSLDPTFTSITWTGTSGFPSTTITTDDSAGLGLVSSVDGSPTVSSSPGSFGVTVTGPGSASTQYIYVTATATISGSPVSCGGTIKINPTAGGGSSSGGGGPHRPPWLEF
jgi:hypothetical protein